MSLYRTIIALTDALDLVGIDEVFHGKRVAIMAHAIAEAMDWPPEERMQILQAGMLHDCGVSRTNEHNCLTAEMEWSGAEIHCLCGESYLLACPPLAHFAPLIRWHHTRWHDMPLELPETIRLQSNLIFLADRIDVLQAPYLSGSNAQQSKILVAYPQIIAQIEALSGSLFAPELVAACRRAAGNEAFWLSQESAYLDEELERLGNANGEAPLAMEVTLDLARLFARVVDAKSEFTREHSLGVAKLARYLASLYPECSEHLDMVEAAGLLHDLGKLRLPDAILDKPGPLTADERAQVKRHAYDSFRILDRVFPDTPIPHWAGQHHEELHGHGYPFHLQGAKLDLEARIIAVADVFQALSQNRPYRGRLAAEAVFAQLQEFVANDKLDAAIVDMVGRHLETCYRIALAPE